LVFAEEAGPAGFAEGRVAGDVDGLEGLAGGLDAATVGVSLATAGVVGAAGAGGASETRAAAVAIAPASGAIETADGPGPAVSADAWGCSALTPGPGGGGPPDGGAPLTTLTVSHQSLPPDIWLHGKVVVTPSAKNDGSGQLTLDVQGATVPSTPVPIPVGTLTPSGAPLVGFAASVNGAGPPFEAQFDNITIDLQPQ
jgi:hypothetical protein